MKFCSIMLKNSAKPQKLENCACVFLYLQSKLIMWIANIVKVTNSLSQTSQHSSHKTQILP